MSLQVSKSPALQPKQCVDITVPSLLVRYFLDSLHNHLNKGYRALLIIVLHDGR